MWEYQVLAFSLGIMIALFMTLETLWPVSEYLTDTISYAWMKLSDDVY